MLPLVWDLSDEDGRPLTEGVGEERPCPYPDGRQGWPMNVQALAQVRRHWDYITTTVETTSGPRLTDAFQAALAAIYSPFQAKRPVPAPVSALYKACAGFSQVFCFLLLEDLPRPENLFDWLDQEGWLLGTHQACAGPRAMIDELAACFQRGPGGSEVTEVALQAALAIATYRASQRGGLGLQILENSRAPWMHAVTMRPRRDPTVVRRFFAETPPAVEHFLQEENEDMTPEERDELYRRSLATSR